MTQTTVLKGRRLVDGIGGDLLDGVVVVEGGTIRAVGSTAEVQVPLGARVVDMFDCTLMPGLIDTHVHLPHFNVTTCKNVRIANYESTPSLHMLYALHHARMCFEMGFTTLRDFGRSSYAGDNSVEMVAVREAINCALFPGPRLVVGGRVHITNSHFDLSMPAAVVRQLDWPADGPWELRKMSRRRLRAGCDLIKTCASGGGGSDKEEPDIRNMTQEELDAIVDEAHAFHKPCACHCFTSLSQKMAVRAGVDTIEHCVFTDDEAIAMIKDEGKYVVPTLAHRSDRAIEARRSMGTSEFVVQKMKKIQPHTKETFQRFYHAGVKIAMGTDTHIDPDMGQNAMELEIYVNYGMTPMEAILTATRNAAEAIQLDRQVGTLEPGKLADIIAVDGNPLSDISLLQKRENIRMVMKEGHIYIDRRPERNKVVIHDEEWMQWRRI